ncbi:hypothetical protein B9N43_01340 [Denitratisoma sp. DHT3]|uniref:NnrS family protein n=1 Tax=Denitratisoma sp. DHT3 TaxID=1981880 RepID=UPI001198A0C0|nr:NnrS family protein [Denitratisoma sp. DHT3]QDX80014.1 hypothetical protein B9N43_01340 [Denitratisoma sp. DHT3]
MNTVLGRFLRSTAPLWICPFRPFFLLTAAHGALAMVWWIALVSGLLPLPEVAGGIVVWHAHEMLFGFAMASIVGFLLTAVPEFTGVPPIPRLRLQMLVALWLGGRISFTLSGTLTVWPAALCDLALLLTLIASVARPLWRQPDRRHFTFIYNLLALFAVHSGFYFALIAGRDPLPWLRLTIGVLMALIVVSLSRISMRLVNDVLEAQGKETAPYLARRPRRNLAIFAIAAYSAGEFLLPGNAVPGWLALAAAAAIANLLNDWHVGRVLRQRWVLIPYLVYVCMGLGYALIGIGRLGGNDLISAGEHLLVVGALGLAVLIVMSVAGRMHSGWGLDHRHWLPLAAGLLVLAALVRCAASWTPLAFDELLETAALVWIAAWTIYLVFSLPILAAPRPDGRSGCDEAPPVR